MSSGSNDYETLTTAIKSPSRSDKDLEIWTGGRLRAFVKGGQPAMELFAAETAPPAPKADGRGVYFMRDRGDGIAQFCVRFKTGAIQILSTEA